MSELKKIITYGLTADQQDIVKNRYGKTYDVVVTDCFTDVLAIPAMLVFINPKALGVSEITQLDEVFKDDKETTVIFTDHLKPEHYEVVGRNICESLEHMEYVIAQDLETVMMHNATPGTGEYISSFVKQKESLSDALTEKNKLLKNIEDSVMPPENCHLRDRARMIRVRENLYRQFFEIVQFGETGPGRRKIPFRYELINIILALKLTYGLIRLDDPVFAPHESPVGIDKEWVFSLAEQLKKRKDNSKFLSVDERTG